MSRKDYARQAPGAEGSTRPNAAEYTPSAHQRADVLLARLDGVRPVGPAKWTAICPAHEDRSPSLSLRDTGERVLVHCYAGCDPEDVLGAVGLTWADLYPDPWECARNRPNEAAAAHAKRRFASRPWPDLEHEQLIVDIAAEAIQRKEPLSFEDSARVRLAVERLRVHGAPPRRVEIPMCMTAASFAAEIEQFRSGSDEDE